MVAKFTNLRPAETKPLDGLLALHTPLYPWNALTPFFESIAAVGLPAGIPLAAKRIDGQDFRERAWFALMGGAPAGSALGGPHLLALARLLARTDSNTTLEEIKLGRIEPALRTAVEAAQGETPSLDPNVVRDDLLAMILLPGAFADYRRIANRLLVLAPRAGQLDSILNLAARDQVPPPWRAILQGRITIPWQIGFRAPPPPPPPPPPGTGTATVSDTHAHAAASVDLGFGLAVPDGMINLADTGLNQADVRQIATVIANVGMVSPLPPEVRTPSVEAPAAPVRTRRRTPGGSGEEGEG